MAGKHSPAHAAPEPEKALRSRGERGRERQEKSARSSMRNHYEYSDYNEDEVLHSRKRSLPPEDEYEDEQAEVKVRSKKKKKKPRVSIGRFILREVLMTAAVLLVFALFHHVIPRLTADRQPVPVPTAIVTPAPTAEPAPTPAAAPEEVVEIEPTPDPNEGKTEWQIRFADKFTDSVVQTEDSYSSPNVSVTITRHETEGERYTTSTYFVADIYVAQIENFATYFANGKYSYYGEEDQVRIAQHADAIVSVNGDWCNNQKEGLLVRNGELYHSEQTTNDICVLFYDGTMKTYPYDQYSAEEVIAALPYQSWKFGPELLDVNGAVKAKFNTSSEIMYENPRTGIGYFEPGHYCFVVVDGRQSGYSKGLTMTEFAQIFADLGCKAAYNLDGGQSSVMTFNGKMANKAYLGGRASGDIALVREIPEENKEN